MTATRVLLFCCTLLLSATSSLAGESDRLWYRAAALNWNEALPLGNGRLGAMIFGGIDHEQLSLNEATLWSGGPRDWNNPRARDVLPLVRQAVREKRYAEADVLSKQMQGPYTESYMPMGDLFVEALGIDATRSDYRRDLDLSRAVATTEFKAAGVGYRREAFISRPDNVIVLRFTADRGKSQSLRLRLTSKLRHQVAVEGDELVLQGKCPSHVEPQYLWKIKDADAVQYAENGEGMNFCIRLRATVEGGRLHATADSLEVEGADAVTVLISAATSYDGWDKSPGRSGVDAAQLAASQLNAASTKPFPQLLSEHLADYQPLFRRTTLELGSTAGSERPTDERLRDGIERDPQLAALVFQYARYLLISSSRPGGQPGNLKGIWNDRLRPEWSSNWCLDHDAQMYYYPVEVVNLPETHEPFLAFIEGLAINGRTTARVNYGMRGWVAHHNSDLWRQSSPVGNWGDGNPHWASFALSGPWLAQHFWEHYAFSGDRDFLRNRAWPLMKGAAEFCLDWLVEDQQGHLVTNPSVSPENIFVLPDGSSGQISEASTVDMSLIWELFTSCIDAANILGIEPEFASRLSAARDRLLPPKVGQKGQLQEWSEDWESTDPGHRHLSHLFGIYPGRQWTPFTHPALASAAKQSLRMRDASDYGWSLAWKAACWARLREGDEAYARLKKQILHVDSTAKEAGTGWFFPNLFNADPPWVLLNGNMCVAAAIAEMLLQSHAGEIDLLPALPAAWPKGEVRGLRARGGFEVDLTWAEGRLEAAAIRSQQNGPCRIRAPHRVKVTSQGENIPAVEVSPNVYEFTARAGGTYHLRPE